MAPDRRYLVLQPQPKTFEVLHVLCLGDTLAGIDELVETAVLDNELAQIGLHDLFIDCMRHIPASLLRMTHSICICGWQ